MFLLVAPALAYESEPQDVVLLDDAELFTDAEYSTGYLPSGWPVAVEFRIDAVGGAAVAMEGAGDMSWPDALALVMTGDTGSGLFVLDASLDAVTTVLIDISDLGYYDTFEIDRRTLGFDGYATFDPFALDSRVEIVDVPDSTPLVTYEYDVFTGVTLAFDATMDLVVTTGFEGVSWTLEDAVVTAENETVQLTSERVPDYDVYGIFRGYYDGDISVIFTPVASVCVIVVGCYDLASFEIPVELLSDGVEQDFEPATYTFPLPLLVPGIDAGDFGDVEVGAVANVQLPLANEGSLEAYGTATITGDGEFLVYPETFNALPGTEDGVVLTFMPTVEGAQSGALVLTSNDPTIPDLEIPLTANGTVPDDGSDDEGQVVDDQVSAKTSTCGCSSGALDIPWGVLGLAAATLLWRRRRA